MFVPVVVVDDLRSFPDELDGVVYLRCAATALEHLGGLHRSGGRIGQLWLDHDLGDGVDIDPVVAWLCERAVQDDPVRVCEVLVHSWNVSAVPAMVRSLSRHYRCRRIDAGSAGLIVR